MRSPVHRLLACALLACALLACCVALAAAAEERESQLAQAPFVLGSRFGRSSSPRLMVPRNDKFFFSSRYGKRAPPLEPPDLPPLHAGAAGASGAVGAAGALVCDYTGVRTLYRCRPQDQYHDTRRLEDSSPEEE